jgi:hypothetical protein
MKPTPVATGDAGLASRFPLWPCSALPVVHKGNTVSDRIFFKSLSGSIESFDDRDVPPPKTEILCKWDRFGVCRQAVQFTIEKRYVCGFRACTRTSPWQYEPLLFELSVSDAWAFHQKYDLKRPGKSTALRATTKPENVTPESTTAALPNPENVGEGAEPPKTAQTTKPKKGPSKKAFAAYRLVKIQGRTQAEAAKELYVNQSTVSRWVKSVDEFLVAGGVLPDEMRAEPSRRKPSAMDPSKLDQGPRLDRRGHSGRWNEDG